MPSRVSCPSRSYAIRSTPTNSELVRATNRGTITIRKDNFSKFHPQEHLLVFFRWLCEALFRVVRFRFTACYVHSNLSYLISSKLRVLTGALHNVTIALTNVGRQVNKMAHKLARYSLSIGSDFEWLSSPPSLIMDLLVEDCM